MGHQFLPDNMPLPGEPEIKLPGPNGRSYEDILAGNTIARLVHAFGEKIAKKYLREDADVHDFLEENGLAGTYNEILVAKMYALAIKGDMKAIKMLAEIQQGKVGTTENNLVINFISPGANVQVNTVLESDSWTVPAVTQGESKSDQP